MAARKPNAFQAFFLRLFSWRKTGRRRVFPEGHDTKRVITILFVGLDNGGKSTVLARLRGEPTDNIAPTWGFSAEKVEQSQRELMLYDVGGGERIRSLWKNYYAEVHGAVFVVDAADNRRFSQARDVLSSIIDDARFSGKPILILANKQDIPGSVFSPVQLRAALGLDGIEESLWALRPCVARAKSKKDRSVENAIKWLIASIQEKEKDLNPRIERQVGEQKQREAEEKELKRRRVEQYRREWAQEAADAEAKQREGESTTTASGQDSESPSEAAAPSDRQESSPGAMEAPDAGESALEGRNMSDAGPSETAAPAPAAFDQQRASRSPSPIAGTEQRESPGSLSSPQASSLAPNPSRPAQVHGGPISSGTGDLRHAESERSRPSSARSIESVLATAAMPFIMPVYTPQLVAA